MKQYSFEIEDSSGDMFIAFEISVDDEGKIHIINTDNCSLAEITNDYVFGTNNKLYRIQEN